MTVRGTKKKISENKMAEIWAMKRLKNLRRMSRLAREDDAYLFKVSRDMLTDFSDIPWQAGDYELGKFIALLATLIGNKHMDALRKQKRTKKSKRRA